MSGRNTTSWLMWAAGFVMLAATLAAQTPADFSIPTPRPISPAQGTTTPSAAATQQQNPYLGSVAERNTGAVLQLSLNGAIQRGLRYNLGLVESAEGGADVRAERMRALSALLPQISAHGAQVASDVSFKEFGIKLPAIAGFPGLPKTSGLFGYQDARIELSQNIFNRQLRDQYEAAKRSDRASALSVRDSRDVVVLAVGTAYMQALASAARLESAKAQLASAVELERQTADQVKSEVTPEIDSLRAQVARQTAEQRVTNVTNQHEKDKLTLARITGLAVNQTFELTEALAYHAMSGLTDAAAAAQAVHMRSDLASAEAAVHAAEATVRAARAQKLPVVSLSASYGGAGANVGNFSQVYSISGDISVPLYTGGRIRADIEQAESDLARRRAEYQDLRSRVEYDVRIAWLDLTASESSVGVAERNRSLATRALDQSKDRFANGVTNDLEVVQAEEAVAAAEDNYIDSVYSYDVASISLARAMGGAENNLAQISGGKQ